MAQTPRLCYRISERELAQLRDHAKLAGSTPSELTRDALYHVGILHLSKVAGAEGDGRLRPQRRRRVACAGDGARNVMTDGLT